jgi:adenylate kinase family enzyme
VIGHTGSGKTTFSRALARRLGVPHVELDALHWRSGWIMAPAEEVRAQVAGLLAGDGWVIDGHWTGTLGTTVFDAADEIVWLDLPFRTTFRRLLRRTLSRMRTREPLWETTNRETFRNAFLSRDSILLYSVTSHGAGRRKCLALVAKRPHVRLRSPAEVQRYLAEAR